MKILVTGAAGAIGSHLAERLVSLGHVVVGVDALTSYYHQEIKEMNASDVRSKGAEMHTTDLAVDDLDSLVQEVDVIFHLAAQPGISDATPFSDYVRNNLIATHRLLESARTSKSLKMLFYISTSSVYGARADGDEATEPKPTSHYGVTKLAAEQLALSYYRELGLPVSVLRLFSVYGERERPDKFFHRIIKATMPGEYTVPVYEGSEQHVRSYTYVGDIIDACVLALSKLAAVKGEIINLGNDKTNTTGEGIRLIEKIMGKKARVRSMPRRRGDQMETSANIKKARKLLGYDPKVGLEEGLMAQVKWYGDKVHGKIKG